MLAVAVVVFEFDATGVPVEPGGAVPDCFRALPSPRTACVVEGEWLARLEDEA